jgi:hypothetical protein
VDRGAGNRTLDGRGTATRESTTAPNARAELVCAWVCAICLAFTAVGFFVVSGFVPPPRADLSATEIARFYADNAGRIRAGIVITFLSWTGWGTLVAGLSSQMLRIPGRPIALSILQAIGGAVGLVFLLLPTIILGIAAFRPQRSPDTTQALHDLGWIVAFMPIVPFVLQGVAIAFAVLQDTGPEPFYPRWFAYANIWACVLFVPGGVLLFFKTGPLAYNGLFVFWIPFIIFGAWILLLAWAVRGAALRDLAAARAG